MAISVIIPCHNDIRILDCISSLSSNNCQYEIIISLTEPSKEIATLLKDLKKTKIVWSPVGNLSKSINNGLNIATFNKIVILNSDTVCLPHYLDIFDKYLSENLFVKSKLVHKADNFESYVVAKLRDYVNSKDVFYNPAIGFRKEGLSKIGGYFFNEQIFWSEDSELTFRLKKYGIKYYYTNEAVVIHDSENFKHDLKGAFKIGRGKFFQVLYANRNPRDESFIYQIIKLFNGKSFSLINQLRKKTNTLIALYYIVWKIFYLSGYHKERLFYILNFMEKNNGFKNDVTE